MIRNEDITDRLLEENYITEAMIYETNMNTTVSGYLNRFDEEVKFSVQFSFRDMEHIQMDSESMRFHHFIDQVINGVRSECNFHEGEFCGVPMQISELGGYKLTCLACGDEAMITTDKLRHYDVSRKDAFVACLAGLDHSTSAYDGWESPCRNIYVP